VRSRPTLTRWGGALQVTTIGGAGGRAVEKPADPPERAFHVGRRLLELAPQDGQVFVRLRACVCKRGTKLGDYLPPRLCERERFVPRRVLVRASGRVEIEEQRDDRDDRRDHCQ